MNSAAAITVKGLVKSYNHITAVNGISFQVCKGEVFGLLGPNGAGKTTTLECLEGMQKTDAGSISVAGCDPQVDKGNLRSKLGVQLQSASLPVNIRAGEAMALVCAWHGLPPRLDLLADFGLEASVKKQYQDLSTGQKRRLHLALALAHNPTVVILDEPTAGLDVQARAKLHEAIKALKTSGVTILLATHDMAEAENLCDHLAIIIHGKIAVMGTPEQVTAAGSSQTRVIVRTAGGSLLPGCSIGDAHFIKASEGYGEWMCPDAASAVMAILQKVQMAGDRVEDLRVERPSLEERFLELLEGGQGR